MAETKNILIIDDDDLLRSLMMNTLTQAGYQVKDAMNGKIGLELALSTHPDLIILDYKMPELDGLGVLEGLRADSWGSTVPVIFSTNTYDVEAMNATMKYNVKDYLMKNDISLEVLKEHVQKYL